MRRIRSVCVGGLLGLGLVWVSGCGRPVLSVDDSVVMGGTRMPAKAVVERPLALGFRKGVKKAVVQFSAAEQPIGSCRTQNQGAACTECALPPQGCLDFTATVTINGQTIRRSGTVFHWDPKRTIIAVDIDETLSVTDYPDLMIGSQDRGSRPIRGAVVTMNALARDYHIAYVTARPRFMLERTRAWLRAQGFPAGPLIVSASWAEWHNQSAYKSRALASLRKQWPNLLIGIGDKRGDVHAYLDNRMLTLIVNERDEDRYGDKATTLNDWPTLARYFSESRTVLSNPTALATRISRAGKLTPPPPKGDALTSAAGSRR
jgi:hypothetical protein